MYLKVALHLSASCLQKFHKLEQWKPVAATILPPIENMPVQVGISVLQHSKHCEGN
jgi:hypothetical protein